MIYTTEEVIITTLKMSSSTTKVILGTDEVTTANLKVISATTKVISPTKEVITSSVANMTFVVAENFLKVVVITSLVI